MATITSTLRVAPVSVRNCSASYMLPPLHPLPHPSASARAAAPRMQHLPLPPPPPPSVGGTALVTATRVTKRRSKPSKKVRSSKSNIPGESRYWTPSEHKLFVEALLRFGPKNLKDISNYVGTRNMIQCRTHSQKCFQRLMREAHKETLRRAGVMDAKPLKETYSVSPNCGIALLCVVSEEMTRALSS